MKLGVLMCTAVTSLHISHLPVTLYNSLLLKTLAIGHLKLAAYRWKNKGNVSFKVKYKKFISCHLQFCLL